jgi:small subunit ribosomal protein S17
MAKTFVGTVSSSAADKTIVVTVNTSKTHPLYHKQYTVSKKFMAHDEKNEAGVGDQVVIVETRPISKRKFYKLETITQKAGVKHVEAALETSAQAKKKITATPADTDKKPSTGTANTRIATGNAPEKA